MSRAPLALAWLLASGLVLPVSAQAQDPAGATGSTGAPGPTARRLAPPELTLLAREVAWGGVLRARVGPSAASATLQVRRSGRWTRLRSLPPARTVRILRLRVPRKGSRVSYRLTLGDERGAQRRMALRGLRLDAVGDVNLGDTPGAQIARFGPAWPWASVGPVLRRADIAFANLECAISLRGRPWEKTYTFRGRPSSLKAARETGGLDVVNLANNHAVDFGRPALLDGIRTARSVGLATVGAGADAAQAYRPLVVNRLGLRVAFVGFSEILPFEFRAQSRTPGTAWAFPDRVRASVRAARRDADVVIVTFHWGVERARNENGQQRSLARLAFASGATAVIGAHPHVQQPIRRVGKRRLVAYSLGNFVFGANSPGTSSARILTLDLASDGVRSYRTRAAQIRGGRPILSGR